jgi:hypothetical protein
MNLETRATMIGIVVAFALLAVGVAVVLIQRQVQQNVKPGTPEAAVVDLIAGKG